MLSLMAASRTSGLLWLPVRHERGQDDAVARPETYAALLLSQTREVDVWQTTYLQLLTAEAHAPHPVLEWVRSTGLRPVLGVLTDRAEREAFLAAYESELEAAYPRRDGVVLFPFTRTFAVARVPR